MGKIIWTEKASAHLKAIHDYIAEDSSVYAVRFISSLVKATAKLEVFPMAGRSVPEFEGTSVGLREVIYHGYRIITGSLPILMQRSLPLRMAGRISLTILTKTGYCRLLIPAKSFFRERVLLFAKSDKSSLHKIIKAFK